jgi:hypothetical protein
MASDVGGVRSSRGGARYEQGSRSAAFSCASQDVRDRPTDS